MKGLLFIVLLALRVSTLWAQNITGKVVSLSDNQPIANATVKLLVSNKTIATDKDGKFNLVKNVNYAVDALPNLLKIISRAFYAKKYIVPRLR